MRRCSRPCCARARRDRPDDRLDLLVNDGARDAMLLARLAGLARPAAARMVAAFGEPCSWGDAGRGDRLVRHARRRPRSKRRGAGGGLPRIIATACDRVGRRRWLARPTESGPVTGRVDRDGRLIAADPALSGCRSRPARRSARRWPCRSSPRWRALGAKLGVPLSRAVIAADSDHDLDLWVRAEPDGEGVDADHRRLGSAAGRRPRLALVEPATDDERRRGRRGDAWIRHRRRAQPDRAVAGAGRSCSASMPAKRVGQPLTRLFRLVEEDDGAMPLLAALASARGGRGQRARARAAAATKLITRRRRRRSTPTGASPAFSDACAATASAMRRADAAAGVRSSRSTRRCARRSTGSSPPPTGSSSAATGRCAAIMPLMPATSPPPAAICCRSSAR